MSACVTVCVSPVSWSPSLVLSASRHSADNESAASLRQTKRPPETGGLGIFSEMRRALLFCGLLPRRIERTGIVDLGDLMIREAEHLAQDLVGVLAEQG